MRYGVRARRRRYVCGSFVAIAADGGAFTTVDEYARQADAAMIWLIDRCREDCSHQVSRKPQLGLRCVCKLFSLDLDELLCKTALLWDPIDT